MTTLHVVGLPHTMTTAEFDHCAYTAKVRKFCGMMQREGYKVVLYAGDENEADCTELVTCITRKKQQELLGDALPQMITWDRHAPIWETFNTRVVHELKRRKGHRDVICLITGTPQLQIIDAFPHPVHLVVEFGVGYSGIAAPFQVYESYAWMHAVYGQRFGAMEGDGRFFDAVIHNFYDPKEFGLGEGSGDYYAFMSRMTPRKGYEIAIEATRRLGVPLKIAGNPGDRPSAPHVEYVGLLDARGRSEFLGSATATFMPTLYIEPFGGVAAESLLCGTPVISTDWGAFPELIEQGVDGYRCRTMAEFCADALASADLDRTEIHQRALARFSTENIGPQYTHFFKRLDLLWEEGFYSGPPCI